MPTCHQTSKGLCHPYIYWCLAQMWVYSRSLIKMCWFGGQSNELIVVNIYTSCFKIQMFLPLRVLCVISALWVCAQAKLFQLCLTLCNSLDCSPPGSSAHGILQARILEWVPCPPPGDLPNPGIEPISLTSPALAGGFFTTNATWEALCIMYLLSLLLYILYHNYCLLVGPWCASSLFWGFAETMCVSFIVISPLKMISSNYDMNTFLWSRSLRIKGSMQKKI